MMGWNHQLVAHNLTSNMYKYIYMYILLCVLFESTSMIHMSRRSIWEDCRSCLVFPMMVTSPSMRFREFSFNLGDSPSWEALVLQKDMVFIMRHLYQTRRDRYNGYWKVCKIPCPQLTRSPKIVGWKRQSCPFGGFKGLFSKANSLFQGGYWDVHGT